MRKIVLLVALAAAGLLLALLASMLLRDGGRAAPGWAGGARSEPPSDRRFGEPEKPSERPNVLMIAFDNVRADRVSSYGGPNPTTPHLDALAAQGVRFAEVTAQAPYTPHSFSSLFSSLYVADLPVRVRARPRGGEPLARAGLEQYHWTLAEAMQDAGYRTGAVFQGWFTPAFGLEQGFEWTSYKRRRVPAAGDTTLRWLREWKAKASDRPFFLLSYTFDVHYRFMQGRQPDDHLFGGDPTGYNFDSAALKRYRTGGETVTAADLTNALMLYDEGLYWADRELAPLLAGLDELGLADSTIVVFVSDHGEEFGEHGYLSHGQSNFRTVTQVPLIIRDPRRTGGRVVTTPVMNIDVMPTILDLCDIPVPETAKGLSLAPSLRGEEQPEVEHRPLYSEGAWNGFVGSVQVGRWRFLLDDSGRPHLYDAVADPAEKNDLSAQRPALARHLEELLFLHKREGMATQLLLPLGTGLELDRLGLPVLQGLEAVSAPAAEQPTLSRETEQELKALGYL
jgi:arylsulfatase A-like enzyme